MMASGITVQYRTARAGLPAATTVRADNEAVGGREGHSPPAERMTNRNGCSTVDCPSETRSR